MKRPRANISSCQLHQQEVEWKRDENKIISRALKIESPSSSSRVWKKNIPTTPWEIVGKKKINASRFPSLSVALIPCGANRQGLPSQVLHPWFGRESYKHLFLFLIIFSFTQRASHHPRRRRRVPHPSCQQRARSSRRQARLPKRSRGSEGRLATETNTPSLQDVRLTKLSLRSCMMRVESL